MNKTQLIAMCRLRVPAAPSTVVSDANALIILNNGVKEICRKTKCLPTYADFDSTADQMEYNLSSLISDYLCPMDDGYAYYYDTSDYDILDVVNIGYLNENYSDWQSANSGTPERCVILGGTFYAHPAPDTAVTDGFRLYYCKKPNPMDDTYVYPFGGTVELSYLSDFHTIILDYYEKELYKMLDINDPNSVRRSRAENTYNDNIAYMAAEIKINNNKLLLKSKETRLRTSNYASNPF